LVRPPVRTLDPDRVAVEPVVITHEHPIVVQIFTGQIEGGAVVSPGDRHRVLDDVARLVELVRVVEDGSARWKRRAPGAPADTVPRVIAGAPHRRVRVHAEAALTEFR